MDGHRSLELAEERAPLPLLAWGATWHRRAPREAALLRLGRGGLPEGLLLASFVALSLWTLALHVWQTLAHGAAWTGAFGLYPVDQLQYLAWIQDASKHVLVSNLFVLHQTPHDYLQPAIAISGAAVALGAPAWAALVAWEPVAIAAVTVAVLVFAGRQLHGRWSRLAAVALALFAGGVGLYPDAWLPFWGWGYPFGLLSLACMIGSLLAYARARAERRFPWAAVVLAGLAGWLHPWQGELLILILLGGEALMWAQRNRSRVSGVVAVVGVTALPLIYYLRLAALDPSWRVARQIGLINVPASSLIPLAPLAVGAALAYRHRPRTFLQAATRAWPLAGIVSFEAAALGLGSDAPHTLLGITVPLAVLAVEGIASLRPPAWLSERLVSIATGRTIRVLGGAVTIALVAALTVPVSVWSLRSAVPLVRSQDWLTHPGEQQALAYLASAPQPGGVLAAYKLGVLVPAVADRHTYVGDCDWSPDCVRRNNEMWIVAEWDSWKPFIARAFLLVHPARFLVQDCLSRITVRHVRNELGPLFAAVHRFGCTRVYTLSWREYAFQG